ncbi:MAG: lytic transglycosylase domain-containing protein [Actinobacteria bacterium]|nr:lytic transglycosylase domain-containing protein [Actinomycetota bacterium]
MKRLLLFGLALAVVAGLAGVALWVSSGAGGVQAPGWYARTVYPLAYEGAITASAHRNGLDPALVAAVIYAESRFDARARSPYGAVGLMQVLPETATQIARETGGVAFVATDLEDPRVNIRYGCYYLRSVLDLFGGDRVAAIAAYNAGAGAVGEWEAAARAEGHTLRVADIPYAETRAYVRSVLKARLIYREMYGERLSRDS